MTLASHTVALKVHIMKVRTFTLPSRSPKAVELATPVRKVNRVPTSREMSQLSVGSVGSVGFVAKAADSDSEDLEHSPRLPSHWVPFEYELLEYATVLPPGFAERVGCELEAQERRVAKLRSSNAMLYSVCQEQRVAPSPPTPVEKPKDRDLRTEKAEAKKRLALRANAKQLEERIREVRKNAEKELQELSARERAAQAQHRMLTHEAAEDAALNRKRLWEVESKLQKLNCRAQQLENAKRHAERKATQREEEDRDLKAELDYLQTEVQGFRDKAKEFDSLEQQEEELRLKLRSAKLELRAVNREKADAIMAKIADRVNTLEAQLDEAPSKVLPSKTPDVRAQSPKLPIRVASRAGTPLRRHADAAHTHTTAVPTPSRSASNRR